MNKIIEIENLIDQLVKKSEQLQADCQILEEELNNISSFKRWLFPILPLSKVDKITKMTRSICYMHSVITQLKSVVIETNSIYKDIFSNDNKIIKAKGYEIHQKEYLENQIQLQEIVDMQEMLLNIDKCEENDAKSIIITLSGKVPSRKHFWQLTNIKRISDFKIDPNESSNILFDSLAYQEIQTYESLDQILEDSLKKGYSYERYLQLAKAYFVFSKEAERVKEQEENKLKNDDISVIKNQAHNPSILDLYSKEQLLTTLELLLKELRENENENSLDSLYGISKYLRRK